MLSKAAEQLHVARQRQLRRDNVHHDLEQVDADRDDVRESEVDRTGLGIVGAIHQSGDVLDRSTLRTWCMLSVTTSVQPVSRRCTQAVSRPLQRENLRVRGWRSWPLACIVTAAHLIAACRQHQRVHRTSPLCAASAASGDGRPHRRLPQTCCLASHRHCGALHRGIDLCSKPNRVPDREAPRLGYRSISSPDSASFIASTPRSAISDRSTWLQIYSSSVPVAVDDQHVHNLNGPGRIRCAARPRPAAGRRHRQCDEDEEELASLTGTRPSADPSAACWRNVVSRTARSASTPAAAMPSPPSRPPCGRPPRR